MHYFYVHGYVTITECMCMNMSWGGEEGPAGAGTGAGVEAPKPLLLPALFIPAPNAKPPARSGWKDVGSRM
jgi:hypothetical protein